MPQQTLPPDLGTPARPRRERPGLALAVIVTCNLMLILDATVMTVALPRLKAELSFSDPGLTWVMNAYTLSFGGLLLLGGRAGDAIGRRRVFVAGIALFTLASLVGGLADNAGWLIAARVLQGVGAAAAGPSTIALIATTYPEARARVRALALLSAMAGSGLAIGLIIGGLLTEAATWRWVMFINVPFGVAAVALAPRYVREPARHPTRLDLPGVLTGTAAVTALVHGLIHAARAGWAEPATVAPLAAGIGLLAVFLAVEARTRQPLLPLRLLADRNRAIGYLASLLVPAIMMPMFFFLTRYLQDTLAFSPLDTGLAFLPIAGGMFAMTRVVPRLLLRTGPKPLAVTGALLIIGALVWLTRLSADSTYATALLGPMLLIGVGGGSCVVPLAPVIMATVAPQDAGAAGGLLQTVQQLGATFGLAVLTTVFGAAARHAEVAADPARPALPAGTSAACAAAVGIAVVLLLAALSFRAAGAPTRPDSQGAPFRTSGY